jgi:ribonuclease HI
MKKIIYTDGACSMPSMKGGWGVVICTAEVLEKISGFEASTTNNKMELTACIEGLKKCENGDEVQLFTDSQYVKNGITLWIINWKKNGWKTANKQPVKNIELWMELDLFNNKIKPSWHWVKAHNGDKYNEMADSLATMAIKLVK